MEFLSAALASWHDLYRKKESEEVVKETEESHVGKLGQDEAVENQDWMLRCKSKDRRQTKDYYDDADEELMSARTKPGDRITKQACFVIKNCYNPFHYLS